MDLSDSRSKPVPKPLNPPLQLQLLYLTISREHIRFIHYRDNSTTTQSQTNHSRDSNKCRIIINWVEAALPKVCEVRPDGTKAFEMNWAQQNSKSYRVFRFP